MTESTGGSNVSQQIVDQDVDIAQRQAKTKELAARIFAETRNLYKAVESIPKCGGEFELYNTYDGFRNLMEQLDGRLARMSGRIFKAAGMKGPPKGGLASTQSMIDHSDMLCEKISMGMDNLARRHKKEEAKLNIPTFEPAAEEIRKGNQPDWSKYSALAAKINPNAPKHNVLKISANALLKADGKPQSKFYDVTKVNADVPFTPILKHKHHAAKRVDRMTIHDGDEQGTSQTWQNDLNLDSAHPYEYELNSWTPSEEQLKAKEPGELPPVTKDNLKYVSTKQELEELRDALNSVDEFAVDIEHHHFRSFRGIVCLLQISTRTMDYIIDPFPLWNDMHILNEPFTDPKILKVFHGSECDIIWLQRDFGIYVVNMFDTGRAMRILNYPRYGLAALVHQFCDVDLDKQFQKSDWRIRPLTDEHINYARGDTHYLLYCYDRLRNELITKGNETNNLLTACYNHSKDICLEVFENPRFDSRGYENLLSGRRKMNKRQLTALADLWRWRDETARRMDESLDYVLPNHMLLNIADVLPREMQGIVACCSPVPQPVRNDLLVLHKMIFKARELPMDENDKTGEMVFDLGFGDLTAALKNYELMMADTNRITKLKGTLQTGLDFTSRSIDEELRDWDFKEKSASKRTIVVEIDKGVVNVFGEVRADQRFDCVPEQNVKVVAKIVEKQNEWATPYEHYEVAFAEAQKEAERKRKIEEEEAKKRPKTTYTHLDPSVERKPFEDTEATLATAVIPIDGQEEGEIGENDAGASTAAGAPFVKYDDSQILTKKAMKRKRKLIEKAVDMPIGFGTSAGESEHKVAKQQRQNWTSAPAPEEVETVNYEQYDADMFSQRPKRGGFNPMGQRGRGRGRGAKRGNRRGGGFTKPAPRSMSYGSRGGRGH